MSDFLKDLGQKARTKEEYQSEQNFRYVQELTSKIESSVHKRISYAAQKGEFITTNGKRVIAGTSFCGDCDIEFISAQKRLPKSRKWLYLITGLVSCGFAPFFLCDGKGASVIIEGVAKLPILYQKAISRAKEYLEEKGICVTGIELKVSSLECGDSIFNIKDANDTFHIKYHLPPWRVDGKVQSGYRQKVRVSIAYTVTF